MSGYYRSDENYTDSSHRGYAGPAPSACPCERTGKGHGLSMDAFRHDNKIAKEPLAKIPSDRKLREYDFEKNLHSMDPREEQLAKAGSRTEERTHLVYRWIQDKKKELAVESSELDRKWKPGIAWENRPLSFKQKF